jgi:septum formation protein
MRLILASASPRRAELLTAAGFTFETIATNIDESVRPSESPFGYVRRIASEKSAAAMAKLASDLESLPRAENAAGQGTNRDLTPVVLAADTAVVLYETILGKPRDDRDAAEMLRRLSGRAHDVMTGVSVRQGTVEVGRVETTRVQFAPLTDEDVKWYVGSGEGRDKAGAYAIQGLASRFIPRIDGSYTNVVGLPVATVVDLLRRGLKTNF